MSKRESRVTELLDAGDLTVSALSGVTTLLDVDECTVLGLDEDSFGVTLELCVGALPFGDFLSFVGVTVGVELLLLRV